MVDDLSLKELCSKADQIKARIVLIDPEHAFAVGFNLSTPNRFLWAFQESGGSMTLFPIKSWVVTGSTSTMGKQKSSAYQSRRLEWKITNSALDMPTTHGIPTVLSGEKECSVERKQA